MAGITDARAIECFHLAFLQVIATRLDQRRYILKGGANLRYFFDSHRYSEDIDLDAETSEGWKLEEKVDEVLASPALKTLLRSTGVQLAEARKPKQTDTTRRWQVYLQVPGRNDPLGTRIEFSSRNGETRSILEGVPDRVVAPYAMRPPTVLHYTIAPATEQKILALAGRSETQARDVFDLELLFRRDRDAVLPQALPSSTVKAAMERAFELPFEAFQDQVVPFLEPDVAELYDSSATWSQMQLFVVERLAEFE